ncbi:PREDICTED: intercellular adhesion molecule 3 [Elephantulus edwardii]|uniref:intercellular adhesion molecule 3 n=1 Tax=Elephantulus edwardii TaxID=28737 RepID=UPI0003F0E3D7|nr:PREDICTED: intercellular adhesion molecule 3 [Elephantulus edwardii]
MASVTLLGRLPQACASWLGLLLLVCCLWLPGAQGQASLLQVEPLNPILPLGKSILVNCTVSCTNPENIALETFLSKEPAGRGPNWSAFWLTNVSADDDAICSAFCNGSQIVKSTSITVYKFPERVVLEPLPPWQRVGENLTLRCRVDEGAPRANLTVVLLRGEEELHRQSAEGEPAEVTVTVTVPARREDHGANFTCRTELDLRSRGLGLFENSSASRQLRTFDLPKTRPLLRAPWILEVGRESKVACSLDGVFPVWEAEMSLKLGNQTLNPVVVRNGDMLNATATATAQEEQEDAQVACIVTLGGESLEAQKTVAMYSFVEPILNLSSASAREGTTVTVTCTAETPVQVILEGVPNTGLGQFAQLQLNATENDDGRNFSCKAVLEVRGHTLEKNTKVQLHVLYGPKIDRTHCPPYLKWKEKSLQVLKCQARGNPVPKLQCLQEVSGSVVPVGTPFFVKLTHNGTYRCEAVSSLGNTTLEVVMDIQYRNAQSVTIAITVLVVLSLLTLAVASLCVFGVQKRSGTYRVEQGSTSLPLTTRQPDGQSGEEPS